MGVCTSCGVNKQSWIGFQNDLKHRVDIQIYIDASSGMGRELAKGERYTYHLAPPYPIELTVAISSQKHPDIKKQLLSPGKSYKISDLV